MSLSAIAFPSIDPVLIHLGPLPIRWYALAYIVGLLLGWLIARWLCARPRAWGAVAHPSPDGLDDLLLFVALGVVLGGRLGFVLFYNLPYYAAHPLEAFQVWKGGMSFHGGLVGAVCGIWAFARAKGFSALTIGDLCATVAPLGIFFGRLANFIKPELWGRTSDVAWAMVFPGAGPDPRHPSQLYEAGLEGLALFAALAIAVRLGALRRPGLVSGLFLTGYGLARIFCEFFREPDPQLGFLFGGATMGMLLSLPLIAVGLILIAYANRAGRSQGEGHHPA